MNCGRYTKSTRPFEKYSNKNGCVWWNKCSSDSPVGVIVLYFSFQVYTGSGDNTIRSYESKTGNHVAVYTDPELFSVTTIEVKLSIGDIPLKFYKLIF